MNLLKALNSVLYSQIFLWLIAIVLVFISNTDGKDNLSGLSALLPLGLFYVLGVVSFILVVLYLHSVKQQKAPLNWKTLCIMGTVILMGLSFGFISHLAFLIGTNFK